MTIQVPESHLTAGLIIILFVIFTNAILSNIVLVKQQRTKQEHDQSFKEEVSYFSFNSASEARKPKLLKLKNFQEFLWWFNHFTCPGYRTPTYQPL